MSKSRLEWKVGLFVLIGLVLLAALLIQFSKGLTFFRPTYDIRLHSDNVGGLKPRASVLMSGVQVGTVYKIQLAPDGKSVTITLRIYQQYVIHKDANISIKQSGFLGDQFVAIRPTQNAGPAFVSGDEAQAEAPFDLLDFVGSTSNLLSRVQGAIVSLNTIIDEVHRDLLNPTTLTNLAVMAENFRSISKDTIQTVDKLNRLVDQANGLVQSNSPVFTTSLANISVFSQQLTNLVAENRPSLDRAVNNVESSTKILKNLAEDLQAGRGAAGKLLSDDQLAQHLTDIGNNLSVTTSNLNRLGLWGILWRHKPPKTNAVAEEPQLRSPRDPFH
jgi:phospholipid/cholesterol/gamma-HCH transport system substrate-binding protein